MTYDNVGDCWIADEGDRLEGWTVLSRVQFKDGVDILHVRAIAVFPATFRVVYQRVKREREVV
jgi:hypothetical protein